MSEKHDWRVPWTDAEIEELTLLAEKCCGLMELDRDELAWLQWMAEQLLCEPENAGSAPKEEA